MWGYACRRKERDDEKCEELGGGANRRTQNICLRSKSIQISLQTITKKFRHFVI